MTRCRTSDWAFNIFLTVDRENEADAADRTSHRYRILADTGGEHNSIEATKRGRKRGDMAGNAITEHFDRKS